MSFDSIYCNSTNYYNYSNNYSGLGSQHESESNNNLSNENEAIEELFETNYSEELIKKIDSFNPFKVECETDISLNLNFFEFKDLGSFDETSTDSRQVPEQNLSIDDTDRPRAPKKRKREPSIQGESDTPNSKSKPKEYTLDSKGILAKGQHLEGNLMRVKKGSTACKEMAKSISENYSTLRNQLLDNKILVLDSLKEKYEFTSAYTFQSPTQAASVIRGANTNGRTSWKNTTSKQNLNDVAWNKKRARFFETMELNDSK